MCYFLYGAVNEGINIKDFSEKKSDKFTFSVGTKDDINKCINKCGCNFRITHTHCDCKTSIGSYDVDNSDLIELSKLIYSFQDIRGIKYIYLSKNWHGENNKIERKYHISDIDLISFLANIEDNCLYEIDLYKRY